MKILHFIFKTYCEGFTFINFPSLLLCKDGEEKIKILPLKNPIFKKFKKLTYFLKRNFASISINTSYFPFGMKEVFT